MRKNLSGIIFSLALIGLVLAFLAGHTLLNDGTVNQGENLSDEKTQYKDKASEKKDASQNEALSERKVVNEKEALNREIDITYMCLSMIFLMASFPHLIFNALLIETSEIFSSAIIKTEPFKSL